MDGRWEHVGTMKVEGKLKRSHLPKDDSITTHAPQVPGNSQNISCTCHPKPLLQ